MTDEEFDKMIGEKSANALIPWGPQGQMVYERTYSRTKPDGSKETWPETVQRVVDGNLALGGGKHLLPNEREDLTAMMLDFKIIPAGRHLWTTGVKGRQFLMNCWVSGWTDDPADHFEFTFMRLMEGGGVGANYSNHLLEKYAPLQSQDFKVHIVCDPSHPDYPALKEAGLLSSEYASDWLGAFEVEDTREGWSKALTELIRVHYSGAEHDNRVFDVSRVRWKGARIKTFGGVASGPQPLAEMLKEVNDILYREAQLDGALTGLGAMEIDHAIAKCVVSGGNRRSARMSMMRWDDWQIKEFLDCKSDETPGSHWTTNISVIVDDDFWDEVRCGEDKASFVMDEIAKGMHRNGEPGFWDIDRSQEGEPNQVIATNPCGEITLEPWEPCNLGHVNLAAFVDDNGDFDDYGAHKAHRLMTRFLIRATFADVGDPKSREVLDRNRRIGVGHTGVASMLAKRGMHYSNAAYNPTLIDYLTYSKGVVEKAAREYSNDLRIPTPVKLTTVAPTGTISKMPGVSEGIHPIFSQYFIRRIRLSTISERERAIADDYRAKGYLVEADQYSANTDVVSIPTKDILLEQVEAIYGDEAYHIVESAADLTLDDMLSVQRLYQQRWADNAVSFTANVDSTHYTPEDIRASLLEVGGDIKGATVFPETSMPQAPYERISKVDYDTFINVEVGDGVDEDCANGACPIR